MERRKFRREFKLEAVKLVRDRGVAAVGDRSCFRNGRQFAAWLGLVPRQQSSGGNARLFRISKRGDRYQRTLMIHGACAVLGKAWGKQDPRSQWIGRLRGRRHSHWPTRAPGSSGRCCGETTTTVRDRPLPDSEEARPSI